MFWATVKPLFSSKIKLAENIVLSENVKLIKDEQEIANIFNYFFVNIVPSLGIRPQHEFLNTTDNSQDPIQNAICKYENHRSIISHKEQMEGANSFFTFETLTKEKTEKLAANLNIRKAVHSNDIRKGFGYLFSKYIATSLNRRTGEGAFINTFKNAERKTEEQKNQITDPHISKFYERCI